MKRLSLLFILALLTSFRAVSADYSAVIDSRVFKLLIIQSLPSNTGEEPIYYDGQAYYIKFNADTAVLFIPGVNSGGFAEFGGRNTESMSAETCVMKIKSAERKRKSTRFILESLDGKIIYNVQARVNDNGTADITVRHSTYSGHFKFLARIAE